MLLPSGCHFTATMDPYPQCTQPFISINNIDLLIANTLQCSRLQWQIHEGICLSFTRSLFLWMTNVKTRLSVAVSIPLISLMPLLDTQSLIYTIWGLNPLKSSFSRHRFRATLNQTSHFQEYWAVLRFRGERWFSWSFISLSVRQVQPSLNTKNFINIWGFFLQAPPHERFNETNNLTFLCSLLRHSKSVESFL